jgi:hypothetical protein
LAALSRDPAGIARMGAAARARVLDGFTERDVMTAVQNLYRKALTG